MSVQVDFGEWESIYLRAGAEETRWFTWAFSPNHWSLMQANPWGKGGGYGQGMTVQIMEQWMERDLYVTRLIMRVKNIGALDGTYSPQVIMAPGRF